MKTPEEIFDEAIQAKGLDIVSVRDAELYEAGLDAIKQALSIAIVVGRSEQLHKLLQYLSDEDELVGNRTHQEIIDNFNQLG